MASQKLPHTFPTMCNTCTDKLCTTATVNFLWAKWLYMLFTTKALFVAITKTQTDYSKSYMLQYSTIFAILWLFTCIIQVPHVITWLAIYITLSLSFKVQTIMHDTQKTFSFFVAAVIIIKFITFIYHSSEYIIIWALFAIMVQFMLVCMHITVLTHLFR